ncbi:DUF3713 domain-containing protein [Mycoplasmoides genitalium]
MAHRFKRWSLIALAFSGMGATAIITACSTINTANLFPTLNRSQKLIGFSDQNIINPDVVLKSALNDGSGVDSILRVSFGSALQKWYQANADRNISNRLKIFEENVEDEHDNLIDEKKRADRVKWPIEVQKEYDQFGGNQESWKKLKLYDRLITDFQSLIFNNISANVSLVNSSDTSVATTKENIEKTENKLKFINSNLNDVNGDFFTNLQAYLFSQWLIEENPFLLNQASFNYQSPIAGLGSIYDENAIGASNLNLSYNFPAFQDPSESGGQTNSAKLFEEFDKQLQTANSSGSSQSSAATNTRNDLLDFENKYSASKVLISKNNILSVLKTVNLSAAVIDQYHYLLNNKTELTTTTTTTTGGTSSNLNPLDKFIKSSSATTVMMKSAMTKSQEVTSDNNGFNVKSEFLKINPSLSSSGSDNSSNTQSFWKQVQALNNSSQTATIFDAVRIESNSSQAQVVTSNLLVSLSSKTTQKQQQKPVYVRGDDAIYAFHIDGGNYFLENSSPNKRNFEKQAEVLLMRFLQGQTNNFSKDNVSFSVDLFGSNSEFRSWANRNTTLKLYTALTTMLENGTSNNNGQKDVCDLAKKLLKNNTNLSETIKKQQDFNNSLSQIKSSYESYIKAANKLNNFRTDLANIEKLEQAIVDRANNYIKLQKEAKESSIGWGQPLPYKRANDGSYPSLAKFFNNNSDQSSAQTLTLKTTAAAITSDNEPTREKNNQTLKTLTTEVENKAKELVEKWKATTYSSSQYSEIITLKSSQLNDLDLDLILSLLTDSGIRTGTVANTFKNWYFKNTNSFTNNFDTSNKELKGEFSDFNDLVKQALYIRSWQNLTSKERFGYYKDLGSVNSTSTMLQMQNKAAQSHTSSSVNQTLLDLAKKAFEKELEDPNQDAEYKYMRFLQALMWLVKNGAQNYKNLLQQAIPIGTRAFVSWTVGYDKNPSATVSQKTKSSTSSANENPFNRFLQNPNYTQGSEINWFNDKQTPIQPDSLLESENTYRFTDEPFNNSVALSNKSQGSSDKKYFYGFNGLTINSNQSISTASAGLTQQFFNNYGQLITATDKAGALSQYKDKFTLWSLINKTSSDAELNAFGELLHRSVNVDTNNLSRFNSRGEPLISFDNKKKFLLNVVDRLDDLYFHKFEGYVGLSKAANTDGSNTEGYKTVQTVPLTNDSSIQTLSYVIQITNDDVNKISSNWKNNKANSLGLKKEIFMSLLIEQALDEGTQELAFLDLIRENQKQHQREHQQILVGDKRLYDILGQTLAINAKNF